MKMVSKIKTMFPGDLLRYIAAICDTRRIESNMDKMIALGNLLFTHGIDFEILGGATNRIALQIDGYAVKFAMDGQGYRDNLMEYSLSPELQPYVTKSYETNGYILIAECVEVINTQEKWDYYRMEIRKVLDRLCQDYLLGDVGIIKKNMTNWGIRGGRPIILDYAYCHRATENLFTCSKCGSALTYDSSYDVLLCSDRSGCKARYTYNERKRIQGYEVDENMIRERKADSIRLPKGVESREIEVYEDQLVGDNAFIIDTPGDYYRYLKLKEEAEMKLEMNGGEDMITNQLDALVQLAKNRNNEEAKKVLFQNLGEEETADVPEPVYTENYQENYAYGHTLPMRLYDHFGEEENEDEYDMDLDSGLDALVNVAKERAQAVERKFQEDLRDQEDAYLESVRKRQAAEAEAEQKKAAQQASVQVQQQESTDSSSDTEPLDEEAEETAKSSEEVAEEAEQTEDVEAANAVEDEEAAEEVPAEEASDAVETEEEASETEEYAEDAYTDRDPEFANTAESGIYVNGRLLEVGDELHVTVE